MPNNDVNDDTNGTSTSTSTTTTTTTTTPITYDTLWQHRQRSDCWIALHGTIYDITEFLHRHPGGEGILLHWAGRDATLAFDQHHSQGVLHRWILASGGGGGGGSDVVKGRLDTSSTMPEYGTGSSTTASSSTTTPTATGVARPSAGAGAVGVTNGDGEGRRNRNDLPPLHHMVNVNDIADVAQSVMPPSGYDYYQSGAMDEDTLRGNLTAFRDYYYLRPRVMIDVAHVSMATTMLGQATSAPLYITGAARSRLAHRDGDLAIKKAAINQEIVQMWPTLSSMAMSDVPQMIGNRENTHNGTPFFQLYVHNSRMVNRDLIRQAETMGCRALFITVDRPVLGQRESDLRNNFIYSSPTAQQPKVQTNDILSATLNWNDIAWFRDNTKMDIVLKGIQTGEDAMMAVRHGIRAIVVSNHGGRQLDRVAPAVCMLDEVMCTLRYHGMANKLEVYVDGGIRRGSDIFVCLALGARAVGIGRPVLYGLAAYGREGVERVLAILKAELRQCMMLMGTPGLQDISLRHIRRRPGHPYYGQLGDMVARL